MDTRNSSCFPQPKTSESVPLLSIYIDLVILVSACSVCTSVITAMCNFNHDRRIKVPVWLQACCAMAKRRLPDRDEHNLPKAARQSVPQRRVQFSPMAPEQGRLLTEQVSSPLAQRFLSSSLSRSPGQQPRGSQQSQQQSETTLIELANLRQNPTSPSFSWLESPSRKGQTTSSKASVVRCPVAISAPSTSQPWLIAGLPLSSRLKDARTTAIGRPISSASP